MRFVSHTNCAISSSHSHVCTRPMCTACTHYETSIDSVDSSFAAFSIHWRGLGWFSSCVSLEIFFASLHLARSSSFFVASAATDASVVVVVYVDGAASFFCPSASHLCRLRCVYVFLSFFIQTSCHHRNTIFILSTLWENDDFIPNIRFNLEMLCVKRAHPHSPMHRLDTHTHTRIPLLALIACWSLWSWSCRLSLHIQTMRRRWRVEHRALHVHTFKSESMCTKQWRTRIFRNKKQWFAAPRQCTLFRLVPTPKLLSLSHPHRSYTIHANGRKTKCWLTAYIGPFAIDEKMCIRHMVCIWTLYTYEMPTKYPYIRCCYYCHHRCCSDAIPSKWKINTKISGEESPDADEADGSQSVELWKRNVYNVQFWWALAFEVHFSRI